MPLLPTGCLRCLRGKDIILPTGVDIRNLALRLALYLEDVISEGTTWRAFTFLCDKLYGRKLPLFPEEDAPEEFQEHYDGEVNFDDVRFLIWTVVQQIKLGDALINPHTPGLAMIAMDVYSFLLDNFEKQPINPLLNAVFNDFSDDPYGRFIHYRSLMEWILTRNYPFRVKTQEAHDELVGAVMSDEIDPEVIQYIIDKVWAKTLAMNSVKGKASGKKLLQDNISFLNRFLYPSDYFALHTEI